YQPGMGRFLTADRMTGKPSDPGGWNKYAYTHGDPINRIDPSGSDDCDPNYCVTVNASYSPLDYQTFSVIPSVPYNQQAANQAVLAFQAMIQAQLMAYAQVQARGALQAFATANFSGDCINFIDNALGAGALEVAQLEAGTTNVVSAATVSSSAGATLFPNNPDLAAAEQARDDAKTGFAGATLSQMLAASPNTHAWGQYAGNTIFYNPLWFAQVGSGWAEFTMFHEMLHVAGLGGDNQIAAAFGISPDVYKTLGSEAITAKLVEKCGQGGP
ncbi:MAG TPA: RHS repeat-associated core domain-containing protein, partial [Terriglobales bacterium]|nr:RHS repeat-associated core domain-containing protein [Terriglobales bacterium]